MLRPANVLDLNRLLARRELDVPKWTELVDDGRDAVGRIRELPLGAVDEGAAAVVLVRVRENRLDAPNVDDVADDDGVAATCGALLDRRPPENRRVLVSALLTGVAVIVGVKSLRVIIVALLATRFFRFGANVGRLRDANGRMIGVNVRFFVANVKRDFLRPFSSTSSTFSPSSSFVSSSFSDSSSLSCSPSEFTEPSSTAADGLMAAAVGFTSFNTVADGAILGSCVLSIM